MKKALKPYQKIKKWRKKNPIKIKAYRIVFVAIRNGTLKRKGCEVCNYPVAEAHHEDYTKPLDIIWLCKKHHILKDLEHHAPVKWTEEFKKKYRIEYGKKYRQRKREIRGLSTDKKF